MMEMDVKLMNSMRVTSWSHQSIKKKRIRMYECRHKFWEWSQD